MFCDQGDIRGIQGFDNKGDKEDIHLMLGCGLAFYSGELIIRLCILARSPHLEMLS